MNRDKEIRALLEKAIKDVSFDGPKRVVERLKNAIEQALALLKPCETCGGSGWDSRKLKDSENAWKHCPDCTDKPESQEPAETSELIKRIRSNFEPTRFGPKGFPQINFREIMKPDVMEACDRLEAAEKEKWYLPPELDTPTSPYKGKGLTWIKYSQIEFKRAEELQAKLEAETNRADEAEKSLKEAREREYCESCSAYVVSDKHTGCKSGPLIKQLQAKLEAETKRAEAAENKDCKRLVRIAELASELINRIEKIKKLQAQLKQYQNADKGVE